MPQRRTRGVQNEAGPKLARKARDAAHRRAQAIVREMARKAKAEAEYEGSRLDHGNKLFNGANAYKVHANMLRSPCLACCSGTITGA